MNSSTLSLTGTHRSRLAVVATNIFAAPKLFLRAVARQGRSQASSGAPFFAPGAARELEDWLESMARFTWLG